MREILPLCALLLLTPLSAPAQEPSSGPERAVFTVSIDDSLIVVDSMVRTDDRLVSRVTSLQRARFLIEADLLKNASLHRLHVVVWPWDRTVEDEPALDATFRPLAGVLYTEEGDDLAPVRRIEPGTYPYVGPSVAFIEQVILHALEEAEGDGSVEIPMWTPYGGEGKGRTWEATYEFVDPHTVRISGWEDVVTTYRIDDTGRIVSGRREPSGQVIERTAIPAE
ncbi:MAG: hypothetical protein R3199_09270 [Gemmatimonadota bacterium]|nr:hypothetical protein [Gemmatimonadota bacterium]